MCTAYRGATLHSQLGACIGQCGRHIFRIHEFPDFVNLLPAEADRENVFVVERFALGGLSICQHLYFERVSPLDNCYQEVDSHGLQQHRGPGRYSSGPATEMKVSGDRREVEKAYV